MAKNDNILIEGIIDERVENRLPSEKRSEVFEFFSFEQILKDYDLSVDELRSGHVDGRNDGGIDGFYVFVNGHMLTDGDSFMWPKSGCILEVWIITCKLHETFKQAALDNLAASCSELLDFTVADDNLKADYSEKVISIRRQLKNAYRKVSPKLTTFSIKFFYASRGNTDDIGESVSSRARHITCIAEESFGNSNVEFSFIGSKELLELSRKKPNFSLELPFQEDLSKGETYILLVNLKDYFNFIQDEGRLRRYLFDSNVRDYMGLNRVNDDIKQTLLSADELDFWWLNNGVTILATKASLIGKVIQIQDVQIVNGLQTSESIFNHFKCGADDKAERSVLVKVIVSRDAKARDAIIRATNNQTSVELSALHATDKIQRDIEEILKQHEYYYERRTNFYKNQGVQIERILTPLYLASGYVSLMLKTPTTASKLKSKFMRSTDAYARVFSEKVDIKLWPKIAAILKETDLFLESIRNGSGEYYLKRNRHLLSFITVSRIFNSFNFSERDIVELDLSRYSKELLKETMDFISSIQTNSAYHKSVKHTDYLTIVDKASKKWKIYDIDRLTHSVRRQIKKFENQKVSLSFALLVNDLLPNQPWLSDVNLEIMSKLGCSREECNAAIKLLISKGYRYFQKGGVLYDRDGKVISIIEKT